MHAKPALHNAMCPGLVVKGGPDAEPTIDLDTMLDLTAKGRDEEGLPWPMAWVRRHDSY